MNYELRHLVGPLPNPLNLEISEGEPDPFGVAGSGLTFVPKERFVVALSAGRAVAVAGWLFRDVRVGAQVVAAAGLGSVLVSPSHRGRGLARIVVDESMRTAADAGRTHGILLCRPERHPLYDHLGWSAIVEPVTFSDPRGERRPCPLITMHRSLTGERWPNGEVDLSGPLF